VSVVLPVWDAYVHRLPEALRSIRSQDLPARIVIVDNASVVPLPAIGNGNVGIVRSRERVSAGAARNLGLAEVDTPYVLFWDADDEMLPGTLHLLQDSISSDPEVAVFATAILESKRGPRHRWPRLWLRRLTGWPRLFALANAVWSLYPTTGSAIMRTSLAKDAGGCADLDRGEDALLAASLAFRGRIGLTRQPGRIYRRHAHSLSSDPFTIRELIEQRRLVRGRLREDPGVPGFAKALLPAIAVLQYATIFLIRPAFVVARGVKGWVGGLTVGAVRRSRYERAARR
jgi:hypothetical protein